MADNEVVEELPPGDIPEMEEHLQAVEAALSEEDKLQALEQLSGFVTASTASAALATELMTRGLLDQLLEVTAPLRDANATPISELQSRLLSKALWLMAELAWQDTVAPSFKEPGPLATLFGALRWPAASVVREAASLAWNVTGSGIDGESAEHGFSSFVEPLAAFMRGGSRYDEASDQASDIATAAAAVISNLCFSNNSLCGRILRCGDALTLLIEQCGSASERERRQALSTLEAAFRLCKAPVAGEATPLPAYRDTGPIDNELLDEFVAEGGLSVLLELMPSPDVQSASLACQIAAACFCGGDARQRCDRFIEIGGIPATMAVLRRALVAGDCVTAVENDEELADAPDSNSALSYSALQLLSVVATTSRQHRQAILAVEDLFVYLRQFLVETGSVQAVAACMVVTNLCVNMEGAGPTVQAGCLGDLMAMAHFRDHYTTENALACLRNVAWGGEEARRQLLATDCAIRALHFAQPHHSDEDRCSATGLIRNLAFGGPEFVELLLAQLAASPPPADQRPADDKQPSDDKQPAGDKQPSDDQQPSAAGVEAEAGGCLELLFSRFHTLISDEDKWVCEGAAGALLQLTAHSGPTPLPMTAAEVAAAVLESPSNLLQKFCQRLREPLPTWVVVSARSVGQLAAASPEAAQVVLASEAPALLVRCAGTIAADEECPGFAAAESLLALAALVRVSGDDGVQAVVSVGAAAACCAALRGGAASPRLPTAATVLVDALCEEAVDLGALGAAARTAGLLPALVRALRGGAAAELAGRSLWLLTGPATGNAAVRSAPGLVEVAGEAGEAGALRLAAGASLVPLLAAVRRAAGRAGR